MGSESIFWAVWASSRQCEHLLGSVSIFWAVWTSSGFGLRTWLRIDGPIDIICPGRLTLTPEKLHSSPPSGGYGWISPRILNIPTSTSSPKIFTIRLFVSRYQYLLFPRMALNWLQVIPSCKPYEEFAPKFNAQLHQHSSNGYGVQSELRTKKSYIVPRLELHEQG